MYKQVELKLKSSGIDYSNSGTCALGVLIENNTAFISNLGNSRAVLYRKNNKDNMAIEITYDHNPNRPDEKERIINLGGKVEKVIQDGQSVGPYRCWIDDEGPGIALTRSLGDLLAKKIGIISEPEIHHIEIQKGDRFICLGTDGLFDVMNSAEVCGFIQMQENRENCVEELLNEARFRWDELHKKQKNNSKVGDAPFMKFGCDDITAVIIYINFENDL